MTGIAAIFTPGRPPDAQLTQMTAAMTERGRDGTGVWSQGCFALGACILHTTAESLEAGQPHTNEDESLALVMDGYLTNWEELRRDLTERGAVLRNRSDAELILRAYELWGEDCAARIEGEFAFVIADTRNHRLFAARDHQGAKPLFYYLGSEGLVIASDIKAVLGGLNHLPEPNRDYLIGVAAMQFHLPEETVWIGVRRLLQSHWLSFDGARYRITRYFDLPFSESIRYRTDAEYAEHYRAMLFDAVRRTSRTNRPLAIMVSGGLDSSAVFCIAHRLEEQGRLLAPGILGYTLAAEPGSRAYELPFARAAAAHVGRRVAEVPLFTPPLEWYTQRVAHDCELPTTTNGAMLMGLDERAQADGARVVLTGEGGDEWLQGNTLYYSEFVQNADITGFWRALRADMGAMGWGLAMQTALRKGLTRFVPDSLRRARHARLRHQAYGADGPLFWLTQEGRSILERQNAEYNAALPKDVDQAVKLNQFYAPTSAFGRAMTERYAGVNGLEYRNPMLTRQFIAFSVATPGHLRRRGGVTKVIHRMAMQGVLPPEILERRTKADFPSDATDREMADFCAGPGRRFLDDFHEPSGLARLIASVKVSALDEDYSWEIWGAYAVAAFLMHYEQIRSL